MEPTAIAEQRHGGAVFEWFRDAEHMGRFDDWSTSSATPDAPAPDPALDEPTRSGLLVDEVVVRGADWLQRRWRDGGEKLKHIAIARRADGLSAAEFSERWRARAGTLGRPGSAGAVRIPDEARGLAYVQNHPLAREAGEWAYDACNEVYFDDLDGLRRRIEWFDRSLVGGVEDDLVQENWFLAVRETVVIADAARPTRCSARSPPLRDVATWRVLWLIPAGLAALDRY